MSSLLDMFQPDETFATTTGVTTWDKLPNIRVWRINANGTPEEITKENNQ